MCRGVGCATVAVQLQFNCVNMCGCSTTITVQLESDRLNYPYFLKYFAFTLQILQLFFYSNKAAELQKTTVQIFRLII